MEGPVIRDIFLLRKAPVGAVEPCRLFIVLTVLVLVPTRVFCLQAKPENLVSANFNHKTDGLGFRWDISPQGMVNDGSNDCFDGGLYLRINGNNFNANKPMMTADGSEYVLSAQMSGINVTRRVFVDLKRGGARYIEVLENPGQQKVRLNVEIRTVLGSNCQQTLTSTGAPFAGALGRKDIGLVSLSSSSRPCVLFLLADANSKHVPSVSVDGNRTYTVTYDVEIKPGKTASVVHWVAQRPPGSITPANAADQFGPFYKKGLVKPEIPRDLKRSVLNFRSGSALGDFAEAAPTLQAVLSLAEELAIERGESDVLVLREEASLKGSVQCPGLEIEGPHGALRIDFGDVVLLQGGAGLGRTARLYMRNGEILTGNVRTDKISMTTDAGFEIDLAPETIDLLFTRATPADGRPSPGTIALIQTHYGDRLAVLGNGPAQLDAVTAWGPLTVGLDEVRRLLYVREPQPSHELLLADNSRLRVILRSGHLALKTFRFGEVKMPLHAVSSIVQVKTPAASTDKGREEPEWMAEIRDKLDETITLELADVPLREAIAKLAEEADVEVALDPQLENKTLDRSVSLTVADAKAGGVLKQMIAQDGLAIDFKDGALYITKAAPAAEDAGEVAARDTAAPVGPTKQTLGADWEKEFEAKLDEKVSFEFVQTPLSEVVRFLQNLTGLSMILDPRACEEVGDVSISLKVSDMRLRLALGWILRLANLTYDLRDGAIFISTPEGIAAPAKGEDRGEPEPPPAAAHCLLAGENLVVGSIDLPCLHLVSSVGSVPVETGRIAVLERSEDEGGPGGRPIFTLELSDGTTLTGPLAERILPIRWREAIWKVPARHIISYRSAGAANAEEGGNE